MRHCTTLKSSALAAVALALLAPAAWAQPGPDGKGKQKGPAVGEQPRGPLTRLLGDEKMLKDLEITDEQRGKLQKLSDSLREQMREQIEAVRDLTPEERRERRAEFRDSRAERREQVRAKLAEILNPEQVEKLQQLRAKAGGPRVDADGRRGSWGGRRGSGRRGPGRGGFGPGGPDGRFDPARMLERVADRLDLTDEQREKFEAIHEQTRDKVDGIRRKAHEKVEKAVDEMKESVRKMLSEEQVEKWEQMRERLEQWKNRAARAGGPGFGPPPGRGCPGSGPGSRPGPGPRR